MELWDIYDSDKKRRGFSFPPGGDMKKPNRYACSGNSPPRFFILQRRALPFMTFLLLL